MKLSIGSTIIEITRCTRMRDQRRGFYLDIEIPEDNIGMDELKALFKDNQETILVTEDDGNTNMYMGFALLSCLSLENGVYRVAQACVSEIEAQLSMTQNKIAVQDSIIEAQAQQIISLEEQSMVQDETSIELYEANTVLTEQVATLEDQVAVQESANTVQDEALIELYELVES